ncbi:MAG: hypothetical protein M1312_01675 [Patescibacteria group bacterium]|nr:hypothetical protein [Patescibacteria group bacterium]
MDNNKPLPEYLDRDKWGMSTEDAIGDQLARAGITAYVFIDGDGQGQILPSGPEENSGIEDANWQFIASDGRIYNVWLRWNPNKKAPDGSMGYYELEEWDRDSRKFVPWTKYPPPIPPMKRGDVGKIGGPAYLDPDYIQARKLLDLPVSDDQEEILRDYIETHPEWKRGETFGDYLNAHPDRNRVKGLRKTVTVLNHPPKVSE